MLILRPHHHRYVQKKGIAVGAHEIKKKKQTNQTKTKQKSLSLVEGQRWGGEMGLSSFSTAAENYIKLDAM